MLDAPVSSDVYDTDPLPRPLGGEYVLTDVRWRVRPRGRGDRVADCPVCDGHLLESEWHLAATVERRPAPDAAPARHLFCSRACFADWLGLYPAPGHGIDGDSGTGTREADAGHDHDRHGRSDSDRDDPTDRQPER